MADLARPLDPNSKGVLFSEDAVRRIQDAVRWVESRQQNYSKPPPRRSLPQSQQSYTARVISASLDGLGYWQAVVTVFDPTVSTWSDYAQIHLATPNGETLTNGDRYSCKPIGPASDGVPIMLAISGPGIGGSGGGGGGTGTSVVQYDLDYTALTANATTQTFTLSAMSSNTVLQDFYWACPTPFRFGGSGATVLVGDSLSNTLQTGFSITPVSAFFAVSSQYPSSGSSFNKKMYNMNGATGESLHLLATATGANLGNGTVTNFTQGHITFWFELLLL